MGNRIRSWIERLLQHSPEWVLNAMAILFSGIKRRAALSYAEKGKRINLIRFCDFIITLCNGNRFIEFELSNICNAQCIFCPYPDMLRTDKKFMHMSKDTLEKNIEKMKHFSSAMVSFTPTTGDTLLHPEWDKFIERMLNDGHIARSTMFTNAIKLDKENIGNFIKLLKSKNGHKMSEVYFSVGGLDADTYKTLYKVDRFNLVAENINAFLDALKHEGLSVGIHIHVKLLKDGILDKRMAESIFNRCAYPFVYYSQSNLYFSNDVYTRNALISYRPADTEIKRNACAYLQKTRFAADGAIWADGCVISEMPGDSSLKLGDTDDDWSKIETGREALISNWEKQGEIPLPCKGCTMYRPR